MNSLRGIAGRTYDYSDEDHLLSAGGTTYQYEVDGFLSTKTEGTDVTAYVYSSRGELLSVNLPGGRLMEYLHDPLRRRIAKKVDGVVTEKYLWQGLTRLLAVYDGNDNLVMRFEYADGRMPVAMTKGGAKYYLAYDQVGSLRVVADSAGNVIKKVEYDSFGNIISETTPSFFVPFGFAGGLHDRDTGIVRFGFRDYDPDVGRWTAKDPIGFRGDVDLYGYCVSDPVNWTDPTGLDSDAAVITGTGTGATTGILGAWSYLSLPVGEGIAVSASTSAALVVASGVAGYIAAIKVIEGSWWDGGLGIEAYDVYDRFRRFDPWKDTVAEKRDQQHPMDVDFDPGPGSRLKMCLDMCKFSYACFSYKRSVCYILCVCGSAVEAIQGMF